MFQLSGACYSFKRGCHLHLTFVKWTQHHSINKVIYFLQPLMESFILTSGNWKTIFKGSWSDSATNIMRDSLLNSTFWLTIGIQHSICGWQGQLYVVTPEQRKWGESATTVYCRKTWHLDFRFIAWLQLVSVQLPLSKTVTVCMTQIPLHYVVLYKQVMNLRFIDSWIVF